MTGTPPQPRSSGTCLRRRFFTGAALAALLWGCASAPVQNLPALAATADDFDAPPGDVAAAGSPASSSNVSPAKPPASAPEPQTAPASTLTDHQQRQLQVFSTALLNPASDIDADTRRSAAQELLAMDIPEAFEPLAQALHSGNASIMLAVVTAMQSAAQPPAALMAPAVEALAGAPAEVVEPLAWVLNRYGDEALTQITALAQDHQAATAQRLGPIRALGAFDSQKAAAELMHIVNDSGEASEIVNAACGSLERISGLTFGNDVQQWRAWWKEAAALPARQWTAFVMKSLGKRTAQLQQELQKQREANDRVSKELFATYRDLYPSLPTDEQLRRLPQLLQNPLTPVREFAISRISLLLRDSVRIPLEVQQKIAERVADDVPSLRAQAAKLLDELNYEQTGPTVGARLANEQNPRTVSAFLEVLANHPCAAGLEAIVKWLRDADMCDQSAAALWAAFEASVVTSDQRQAILKECRSAAEQRRSPGVMKLLARLGDDKDLAMLIALLDGDDATLKGAVADGFCQRGLRQPLIDRSHDPVVFPFAIRVIANGPPDISSLKMLANWTPDEQSRSQWQDAMQKLIDGIPAANLLGADDVLAAANNPNALLRIAALSRASALPHEQWTAEQRETIITRLVPLLIDQGDAARAFALLEGSDCESPALRGLCFQASALTGHYDKAAEIEFQPGEWITLLMKVAQRDLTSASPLCREIARRFAGKLTDDEQSRFDQIAQTIRESAAVSATTRSQPGVPQPD